MSDTPELIDRKALHAHRQRASSNPAVFLHEFAMDEAEDRVSLVNKTFTDPAIVTPMPDLWRSKWNSATIVPDTDILDLQPESHDLLIHAMALHWSNDPVGQLVQCRRALKPDGLLLCFCLGGQTLSELRAALGQAEIEVTGGISPRVLPMGEIRDLGALLQRAGFALPVADGVPLTVQYRSPVHLMHDLRAMGEVNALSQRSKHMTRRAVLMKACEHYVAAYGQPDGLVPASFEIITLTGWSPDASQPRALRPGSARHRLADALGAKETPLGD